MRAECWKIARMHGTAYVQIHVKATLPEALARNAGRGPNDQVPDDVLKATAAAFEEPETSGCLWDKLTITIEMNKLSNSTDKGTAAVFDRVLEMWSTPVAPLVDREAEAERVNAARFVEQQDARI